MGANATTVGPAWAGGVVVRRAAGRTRFLVVSSSNGRHWVLPKGRVEEGEPTERAALREVREESGVCAAVVEPLGTFGPDRKGRRVAFFLMRHAAAGAADEDRKVLWLGAGAAAARLSFAYQRSALRAAAAALRARRDPSGASA